MSLKAELEEAASWLQAQKEARADYGAAFMARIARIVVSAELHELLQECIDRGIYLPPSVHRSEIGRALFKNILAQTKTDQLELTRQAARQIFVNP